MTHLTFNSGHCATIDWPIPDSELQAVLPLVQSGGVIPTRSPFRVEISHAVGGAVFTIYRAMEPITTTGVAWTENGAEEIWPSLEDLYLTLSDKQPDAMVAKELPNQPKALPWLTTILLPHIAMQNPKELRWMGAFEHIFAKALIRNYL